MVLGLDLGFHFGMALYDEGAEEIVWCDEVGEASKQTIKDGWPWAVGSDCGRVIGVVHLAVQQLSLCERRWRHRIHAIGWETPFYDKKTPEVFPSQVRFEHEVTRRLAKYIWAAQREAARLYQVPRATICRAVTGQPRASKDQIIEMVPRVMTLAQGVVVDTEHKADACAIAYTLGHHLTRDREIQAAAESAA